MQGGIAHGIGNALLEWMGYDDGGQPMTTTFAEYLLPGATEVPMIDTLFKQTPSPLNPLGAKGAGEVGTIPAAAAVIVARSRTRSRRSACASRRRRCRRSGFWS